MSIRGQEDEKKINKVNQSEFTITCRQATSPHPSLQFAQVEFFSLHQNLYVEQLLNSCPIIHILGLRSRRLDLYSIPRGSFARLYSSVAKLVLLRWKEYWKPRFITGLVVCILEEVDKPPNSEASQTMRAREVTRKSHSTPRDSRISREEINYDLQSSILQGESRDASASWSRKWTRYMDYLTLAQEWTGRPKQLKETQYYVLINHLTNEYQS